MKRMSSGQAAAAVLLILILAPLAAANILDDCFTALDGTNLVGRRLVWPSEGEPYVAVGEVHPGDAIIQSNQAHIASGAVVASRIGTTKNDWFWCNVEVTMGDNDFVGLGFYSQPRDHVLDNFSGWVLTRSGDLRLYVDGAYTGQWCYSDGFDPYAPCFLGTWDYLDVGEPPWDWSREVEVRGGTAVGKFNITGLTQANTEYVGIFVGPSSWKTFSDFDNLNVWWIPEPATLLLLGLGGLTLLRKCRV